MSTAEALIFTGIAVITAALLGRLLLGLLVETKLDRDAKLDDVRVMTSTFSFGNGLLALLAIWIGILALTLAVIGL